MLGDLSPKLKPLLLPQLVEERKKQDIYPALMTLSTTPKQHQSMISPPSQPQQQPAQRPLSQPPQFDTPAPWPYTLATTNSSSSDITSPLTPTFSHRGHTRYSSSTSSVDLPPLPSLQESPVSPPPPAMTSVATTKTNAVRPLPDVKEEPTEHDTDPEDNFSTEDFGLYSCLCDEPCVHRLNSTDDFFSGAVISDFDIDDYDIGFLSDGDITGMHQLNGKKRSGTASPLTELTTRLSSRFPTIQRWRSTRRSRASNPPTADLSLENVLSRAPSSRSSSISAAARYNPDRMSIPPTPAVPQFGSAENISVQPVADEWSIAAEDRESIERDRAMATTPLLPPLMTALSTEAPTPSPLQSPTVEETLTFTPAIQSPIVQSPTLAPAVPYSRPALSSRPSMASLRQVSNSAELPPLAFPGLPDYDEWSDRLGHANFTITPAPYELTTVTPETVTKFCEDWDLAQVNYTKHLVRTGENYGQTSKIYGLTEAKWAEIESSWKLYYEDILQQTQPQSAPMSKAGSRSRSRSRAMSGRGRSVSAVTGYKLQPDADAFAGMEWRRLEDCLPSAVPQMLEALDADGKFPHRGDEDIVGPMQRDAFMVGACADAHRVPRFWRNLAGKVGLGR